MGCKSCVCLENSKLLANFFFNNWSAKSVIAIIDLRHAPIKIIYCVASNNINHLFLRPIILQYNISHPWWFLCWERREVPVRSSLFACSAVNEWMNQCFRSNRVRPSRRRWIPCGTSTATSSWLTSQQSVQHLLIISYQLSCKRKHKRSGSGLLPEWILRPTVIKYSYSVTSRVESIEGVLWNYWWL